MSPAAVFRRDGRQEFVDVQIRDTLYKIPCRPCRVELMFAEYPAVCDAKILHQLLFRIMCDQSDIIIVTPYWYLLGCKPTFNTKPIPIKKHTTEVSP